MITYLLQGLVNRTLSEKRNAIIFQDCPLQKIKEGTPSHRQVKKLTEAVLDNQDFVAPGAIIVRNETKKAIDVKLKR